MCEGRFVLGTSEKAKHLKGELLHCAGGSCLSSEGAEQCGASTASFSHILLIREEHL